jgi:predicted dehydrogenase
MVRHLSGTGADAVTAVTAGKSEVEDSVSVSVRYANGALGSFFGCSNVPGTWEGVRATELRVWGTQGHVSIDGEPEIYSLRSVEGLRTNRWHSLPRRTEWNLRAIFISRFATAVAGGQPPDITAADGLENQAFIEAAYVSSETGQQGVSPTELLSALDS